MQFTQGHLFRRHWRTTKGLHSTVRGFGCEGSEDIASERSENRHFRSTTPLSFEAPSLANPCRYPHKPYVTRNSDPCGTFLPLIVWVYLHSLFVVGSERHVCNVRNRAHAHIGRSRSIQGHPRSLILVPIESEYAISYWSIVTLVVLFCTISEIRWLIGRKIVKNASWYPLQSHKSPSLGATPFEFRNESDISRN